MGVRVLALDWRRSGSRTARNGPCSDLPSPSAIIITARAPQQRQTSKTIVAATFDVAGASQRYQRPFFRRGLAPHDTCRPYWAAILLALSFDLTDLLVLVVVLVVVQWSCGVAGRDEGHHRPHAARRPLPNLPRRRREPPEQQRYRLLSSLLSLAAPETNAPVPRHHYYQLRG